MVLQGPADLRTMTAAMRPGVERSREGGQPGAPVCLVITPTIEQAMTAADQARRLLADPSVRVAPVTGAVRARRVLGFAPVAVVTGTPADLLAVRRDAALSVEQLQTVVIVGLDEILAANGADTLQALLSDAPDNVSRVATLEHENEASEAFLEAQLRRARRITPPVIGDTPLAVTPRFVLTSPAGRADALRLVLDETDPPSLVLIAASDAGMSDATAALARLGIAVDGLSVQVTRQPTAQHVALAVLWEAPLTHDALVEALAMRPVDAVALLLPDELPAFRRMTLNLAEAWTPAPKKAAAEDRVQQLRTALRSTLANGNASASELALLAPLLETHDALELACAALRLYEGARRDALNLRAKAATSGAKSTVRETPREQPRGGDAPAAPAGRQRVFLAAGKRDNVRVGDIVGAIANEAGVPGEKIGQVDLYESHATVELDAADAAKVVAALGNATLRGRRLSARIDERSNERPSFGDRGPRREFGGDRGGDRGPRRDFGGDRGGDRGPRRDFGDRGPRRDFGGDRGPRREGGDRGERSDRGERPARSFDRGDRGPRRDAGGDRGGDRGPRGGFSGGFGGGRPPRAADERRSWGDRPVGERTESRGEWSERAERMKHAKRERPSRPSFGQDGEA